MEGSIRRRVAPRLLLLVVVAAQVVAHARAGTDGDPHYTPAGYFDLFVCHWPDRPPFLIGLFSTTRYNDIASVEITRPDGRRLGEIALTPHTIANDADGEEKRIFKTRFPPIANAPDGWYQAVITLKNGSRFVARDFVAIRALPIVAGLKPQGDNKPLAVAKTLRWRPLAGDVLYRVTIYDMWQGKTEIYASDLLRAPRLTLPDGVLKPGGAYVWRVHARQATTDAKWGDFNHGSRSAEAMLAIAP